MKFVDVYYFNLKENTADLPRNLKVKMPPVTKLLK